MGMGAAAVTAVGGIAQMIMGAKQAKAAREAEANYDRQELTNVYEGVGVSKLGSDLQREELATATATGIKALQAGGARTLVGGIGNLQAGNIASGRAIGADLDRQQKALDQLVAQDNVRIQRATERREEQDLAGIGQQMMVGQQNLMGGIKTIGQGLAGAGGNIDFGGFTPQVGALPDFDSQPISLFPTGDIEVEQMPN